MNWTRTVIARQASRMELHGIHVPLVTPFTADGAVALDALERLARDSLEAGAAGLVALGTTGEPGSLTTAEQDAVIEVCRRACDAHGAPLTVGAGHGGTARTAEALAALDGRADAALVAVPAFVRPGEAGVLAHFRALAGTSPLPLVIYHIPYRTGQPLGAATLLELLALPAVAGVKYAPGGIDEETIALLAAGPRGVMAGDDLFLSPLLALGADGGILASAHLETARFVALHRAWQDGDAALARKLGAELAGLSRTAFAGPNPTALKALLHRAGRIPTPAVRLPLLAHD
ncbi:dihydrodipicolinate synthase family protein [Kitasatospora sp. YST-16]|uniref:dihydrodipicolinate synthase family protein n=1 Tax=Kitasatospora sp. YST-16 TaxID=2998080 RepID=UPI00228474D2|nr:dihydrodipicolinate synthase family protein [Kitasatospora sp. YST-16]WAL71353.1 dihydrodipicolinate synthase family protein [Kitasatospora sp. YST-16]WNW37390.1 dihydrodipicolinate synthase family protein [Streptomyces sp. Li-HN-5-13]